MQRPPTFRAQIRALAAQGLSEDQIYQRMKHTVDRAYIRRTFQADPALTTEGVKIPSQFVQAAAARRIQVPTLVNRVLKILGEDLSLLDNVLDDGMKTQ